MRGGNVERSSMSRREFECIARWDRGQSIEQIVRETGWPRDQVNSALSLMSTEEERNQLSSTRRGSASLAAAIMRECEAAAARRAVASTMSGTAMHKLSLERPAPRQLRQVPGDRRPPAAGREPCPYCQTRGDLGCAHFAPCEPVTA